jgi:hypothetical protein
MIKFDGYKSQAIQYPGVGFRRSKLVFVVRDRKGQDIAPAFIILFWDKTIKSSTTILHAKPSMQ